MKRIKCKYEVEFFLEVEGDSIIRQNEYDNFANILRDFVGYKIGDEFEIFVCNGNQHHPEDVSVKRKHLSLIELE